MEAFLSNRFLPLAAVSLCAFALFLLEKRFPLRRQTTKLLPRLSANLFMAALTFIAAMLLVRPASMFAIDWSSNSSFGLLNFFQGPPWLKALAGFLLLDLSFYYWHRLNHRLPFLWRFHNTHHIDPGLDVSTAFRFHFGEVALSSVFRIIQVIVIAPGLSLFLAYEFIFQLGTFFHHSNLKLPKKIDSYINFFAVTPRMHGIHHSNYREETDSNYSVVFSFWDRLHRTFNKNIPQSEIEIGVPAYSSPKDNRIKEIVADPFRKQRDYWQGRIRR